jgi:hypothetical protein
VIWNAIFALSLWAAFVSANNFRYVQGTMIYALVLDDHRYQAPDDGSVTWALNRLEPPLVMNGRTIRYVRVRYTEWPALVVESQKGKGSAG